MRRIFGHSFSFDVFPLMNTEIPTHYPSWSIWSEYVQDKRVLYRLNKSHRDCLTKEIETGSSPYFFGTLLILSLSSGDKGCIEVGVSV
jgi:hypothetical protein